MKYWQIESMLLQYLTRIKVMQSSKSDLWEDRR